MKDTTKYILFIVFAILSIFFITLIELQPSLKYCRLYTYKNVNIISYSEEICFNNKEDLKFYDDYKTKIITFGQLKYSSIVNLIQKDFDLTCWLKDRNITEKIYLKNITLELKCLKD
jgi:hypothetical protein